MPAKEGPVAEADGIMERADRAGRLRIARDVVCEVVAWLLMHHARELATLPDPPIHPTPEQMSWSNKVKEVTERRAGMIQDLIERVTDSFLQKDYGEALMRVGMMIAARSDTGEPLTKIGRLFYIPGVQPNGNGKG